MASEHYIGFLIQEIICSAKTEKNMIMCYGKLQTWQNHCKNVNLELLPPLLIFPPKEYWLPYSLPILYKLMFMNYSAGENSWESLGLQEDQTSQSYRKSTLNTLWKDWCWSSKTLTTWWEEPTYWKRPWCWKRLKGKGEEASRGWDGYIASLTKWTWIWTNSWKQWRTREPDMLQSMVSQRGRHDLVPEQQQPRNTDYNLKCIYWVYPSILYKLGNIPKV